MKIALLGYGKMGKVIERIAVSRGHEIILRKDATHSYEGLADADVAIDFSTPEAAVGNITAALESGIPVISGTTGWLEQYHLVADLCTQKNGAFIYGSNFSLGVNLFFEINLLVAKMMKRFPDYKISLQETHHTEKRDAPSGTAISLAKDIIENSDYSSWALADAKSDEIHIDAKRIEHVPGTHIVKYNSDVDCIELTHTAHSRDGFALGAVIAAEWLQGKTGIFTMKDVLAI
ncbi:MAG: 4-hydroxy-tetrahydrodipicolinate reductase [Flavobacterium sp.]|nr:4-hydroxy-tetrahydrodipicolinate reductase [Flavobacterium sp.]